MNADKGGRFNRRSTLAMGRYPMIRSTRRKYSARTIDFHPLICIAIADKFGFQLSARLAAKLAFTCHAFPVCRSSITCPPARDHGNVTWVMHVHAESQTLIALPIVSLPLLRRHHVNSFQHTAPTDALQDGHRPPLLVRPQHLALRTVLADPPQSLAGKGLRSSQSMHCPPAAM